MKNMKERNWVSDVIQNVYGHTHNFGHLKGRVGEGERQTQMGSFWYLLAGLVKSGT